LFKHVVAGAGWSWGWVSVPLRASTRHLHTLARAGTPVQGTTRGGSSVTHPPYPWEGCRAKMEHALETSTEATRTSRFCFCPMGWSEGN